MTRSIAIIGGGVAGLGAAFKVKRAADEGHEVTFTLVEKDPRLGGKLMTEVVPDPQGAGHFIVDGGSDCFLTEKPAVHRVARMMGIEHEELSTDDTRKRTRILSRGSLHDLPDGVMMFAPTKLGPFLGTGLFSWPGKARMALDLALPPKSWPEGVRMDETLESFVVRRMGRECLDRIAEPLVGGVHASDPAKMSLAATFPRFLEMEQKHGGMIKGFLAARKKAEEMRGKFPPKPGAKRRTFFTSFASGMQRLTDAMADISGRERIRTGVCAEAIRREGERWTVLLSDGATIEADAVIVATESWAAERLARTFDTVIADALAGIESSSSATISLGFKESEIGIDVNAFGLLCPVVEKRQLMAASFSSTKWPGRAPQGRVLIRGFVGGPHNQQIMDESDDRLVEVVLSELRDILGVKGEPLFGRVYRWLGGMPQYTLGHLDRIEMIEARLLEIPGLWLAGGSYRGVGVPNCIESGEAGVSKILREWGMSMAEDLVEPKRHS